MPKKATGQVLVSEAKRGRVRAAHQLGALAIPLGALEKAV